MGFYEINFNFIRNFLPLKEHHASLWEYILYKRNKVSLEISVIKFKKFFHRSLENSFKNDLSFDQFLCPPLKITEFGRFLIVTFSRDRPTRKQFVEIPRRLSFLTIKKNRSVYKRKRVARYRESALRKPPSAARDSQISRNVLHLIRQQCVVATVNYIGHETPVKTNGSNRR